MDIKKYLIEQIKKCRYRINMAKLIDCGILFAAAGGIFGIGCELASLIWQFYYVHLAAGLCFAAGLLAGIGYAVYSWIDMKQAAGRLDSFGLKERMITAYEQMDKDTEFAQMQRQDAFVHYDRMRDQIRISLLPDKRHVLALLLSAVLAAGLGFIPSQVREQAQIRHDVKEQAKEEREELEELLKALEGVDMESLTEEQRERLQELTETLELSREELENADSWESLASATERLDYKYEQAGQSLENLASQMKNPEMAGIAAAEALAKAAANPNGQQMASSEAASSGNTGGDTQGDDRLDEGSGDGSLGKEGAGNGEENGGNGEGSGNGGNGSGDGSGSGNGSGDGEGNGNGSGNGSGDDSGSGNGNSSGSGNGSGRGTGSSNAPHDYISIPNGIAKDSSITGNKDGDQDSDYYRQQNGLAWEGEHVDYNSVIGEYTENAYEGIAEGKYPSGMESVIRDYFEKLNK